MTGVQGVVHRRLVWVLDLRCAVHVLGGFCGRGGVLVWAVHVRSVSWLAGLGCFVVSNSLCVRELLNVLAANGEQGKVGSDWYTGSCAPLCCASPCWLGRFCGVSSMFWAGFVDGVVFWGELFVFGR